MAVNRYYEPDPSEGYPGANGNIAPKYTDARTIEEINAQADVKRSRDMATAPVPGAPVIDATRSNETRGVGMDALSMLRARAEGADTPADIQARQQTIGAVQGVYSGAASVRGGAGARAAASRGAIATGARVQAQGNQDAAALHARGIADATAGYLGASTAQRGADLTLAGNQADLEAGQRDADLQRQQYYEQLALQRKGITADSELNRTAGDSAANAAATQSAQAQEAAKRASDNQNKATAAGAFSGAMGGAQANTAPAPKPSQAQPVSGTGGYGTPDYKPPPEAREGGGPVRGGNPYVVGERGPELVVPAKSGYVLDARKTAALARRANKALDIYKAGIDVGPSVRGGPERAARPMYDGKYLPTAFPKLEKTSRERLDETIGARVSEDSAHAAKVEADKPRYGYFKEEDGGAGGIMPEREKLGGSANYAASRERQPGYMFGDAQGEAPQAVHVFESTKAPVVHEGERGERDREVITSDPKAKREAYDLGVKQGVSYMSGDNAGLTGPRGKVGEAASGRASSRTASKAERPGAASAEDDRGMTGRAVDATMGAFGRAVDSPALNFLDKKTGPQQIGPKTAYVDRPAMTYTQKIDQQFGGASSAGTPDMSPNAQVERQFGGPGPSAKPLPQGSPVGYLDATTAGALRGMSTPSDEKTKDMVRGADPMASANRSMSPSVYEYKPKYAAEAGQSPHEKNVGPMANSMAADPLAKTAIMKRPDGMLAIDKDKGLKLVMGGLADLQAQVDSMKKKRST